MYIYISMHVEIVEEFKHFLCVHWFVTLDLSVAICYGLS